MSWDNVKTAISTIAPTIASAFGTPIAGAAVSALCSAIFGKSNAKPEEILKALGNPDALINLRQAELDFEEKMAKIGLDSQKLEQMNVDSARNREIQLAQVGKRDWTTSILAYLIIVGFFGMLAAIWYIQISESMKPIADIMIGALGAQFAAVCNYYFGSSSGSKQKDITISKAIK